MIAGMVAGQVEIEEETEIPLSVRETETRLATPKTAPPLPTQEIEPPLATQQIETRFNILPGTDRTARIGADSGGTGGKSLGM